jgi:hypothetical protein
MSWMMLSTAIGISPIMMRAEIDATTESTRLNRDFKIFRNFLIMMFSAFSINLYYGLG